MGSKGGRAKAQDREHLRACASAGGLARADKLTPERRREIAAMGAAARKRGEGATSKKLAALARRAARGESLFPEPNVRDWE
jgi:hypothetical protein